MSQVTHKVLILGAGSGGIALAARLVKVLGPNQISILDPSRVHYYQPLWTLVGGGVVGKEETKRDLRELIPDGVTLIQDAVERVDGIANTVSCRSGTILKYDYLVIATGLRLDWHKIKGLEGSLGKYGICSIYDYNLADKTFEAINSFRGGTAVFTMPPVPIKCAGAPQKIMYLADEVFRKNGVRNETRVVYATAGKVIFGVPSFAAALLEVAKRKEIELAYSHRLIEVVPATKTAVFEVASTNNTLETLELRYDLLHVVPPMSAHDYVTESNLACAEGPQKGWLNVHQHTLQHQIFPNIFGIGDVTGVPNSKTGAAIRKQTPVVAENLLAVMNGKSPVALYDGYSSCPLVTGVGKVILAEFGYDGKLLPSFPFDMTKERWSMWVLKRYLLPPYYWLGMLKGRM